MTKLTKVKRSGGPKTPEGKAVAARNSLKTGAYAHAVILPGESEAEFQELKDSLQADLQAVGMLESVLADELSALLWKKLRVDQVESRAVVKNLNEGFTAKSFYAEGLPRQLEFDIALNHPWFWEGGCRTHVAQARDLVARLSDELTRSDVIDAIKECLPVLYWRMVHKVRHEFRTQDLFNVKTEDFEYLKTVAEQSGVWDHVLGFAWKEMSLWIVKELDALEFALAQKPKIEALIPQVKDRRLMQVMRIDGVARARGDLDRAFFRGLKELRAQQEWRLKHQVIDITPKAVNHKTD